MAHGDITHVEIPVADFGRGTSFYNDLFGWRISEMPGFEGYPMWRAPNGSSGGALVLREEGFSQPRCFVEVDSIDDTLAKAQAAGGTVLMAKSPIDATSWWATFTDPDGNVVGLYEGVTGASGEPTD